MTILTHTSLNQLANDRMLAPWASWPEGRTGPAPEGYVRLPLGPEAVRFYHEQGFLVVEGALSAAEGSPARARW